MKKIFIIQFITFLLCTAMIAEVSLPMAYTDVIAMEADSEKEHEEGKEESKEKTTEQSGFSIPENNSMLNKLGLASYTDPYWNSPSIDFQTPPPELS